MSLLLKRVQKISNMPLSGHIGDVFGVVVTNLGFG